LKDDYYEKYYPGNIFFKDDKALPGKIN